MVIPEISEDVQRRIEKALTDIPAVEAAKPRTSIRPASAQAAMERAGRPQGLPHRARAREGNAQICTYAWAYRYIFDATYSKWSQAYSSQVVSAAEGTAPAELPGLGAVRLDAFIVASKTGLPSDGHWDSANYDREDWETRSRYGDPPSLKFEGGRWRTSGCRCNDECQAPLCDEGTV